MILAYTVCTLASFKRNEPALTSQSSTCIQYTARNRPSGLTVLLLLELRCRHQWVADGGVQGAAAAAGAAAASALEGGHI
jgi:hypothetical protein